MTTFSLTLSLLMGLHYDVSVEATISRVFKNDLGETPRCGLVASGVREPWVIVAVGRGV